MLQCREQRGIPERARGARVDDCLEAHAADGALRRMPLIPSRTGRADTESFSRYIPYRRSGTSRRSAAPTSVWPVRMMSSWLTTCSAGFASGKPVRLSTGTAMREPVTSAREAEGVPAVEAAGRPVCGGVDVHAVRAHRASSVGVQKN